MITEDDVSSGALETDDKDDACEEPENANSETKSSRSAHHCVCRCVAHLNNITNMIIITVVTWPIMVTAVSYPPWLYLGILNSP